MVARLVSTLLLFLLLAGCLGGKDSTPPLEQSPSVGETSSSASPSNPPSLLENASIAMDGCGKGITALVYAPQALYPSATPHDPSWSSDSPVVAITLLVQECSRISVGPFERGPVRFLLEVHDNLVSPTSCREVPGDYTSDEAFSQLWLDDAEIAAYLQATYGLPVRFASISVVSESLGTRTSDHWTFGVPGEPVSTLDSIIGATDTTSFPVYRLYYSPSEGRVSFADFTFHLEYAGLDYLLSTGKVAPPLIYGSTGTGDLVAYGSPSRNSHFSVEIHQFGDDECKEPL
jgi:hypothetical protein